MEERDEGEYDYFGTFYNCTSLASIVLPPSLQNISVASFRGCTALTRITIPASVTRIQSMAFLGCTNLDVYMESETPCQLTVDPHGTYDHPYSFGFLANGLVKTIYVPTEACLDTYKNATYWTSYKWRIKWVNEFVPSVPVPEAVDLGLSSGIKWASFNVGASAPEEYGDYYAWGETEPKSDYSWSNYKFRASGDSYSNVKFSKYVNNSNYGTVDDKTVLDPEDDVAHVKLGGSWRMPTEDDWTELKNECTWSWSNNYNGTGVRGRIITATNGNRIFLPEAGRMDGTVLDYEGSRGYIWSSSLSIYGSQPAWGAYLYLDNVFGGNFDRCGGLSVRPVTE